MTATTPRRQHENHHHPARQWPEAVPDRIAGAESTTERAPELAAAAEGLIVHEDPPSGRRGPERFARHPRREHRREGGRVGRPGDVAIRLDALPDVDSLPRDETTRWVSRRAAFAE